MAEEIKKIDLSDKVYKLVIAIIVVVALFYFGQLFYNFQTLPQNYPQEISVSGEGKKYAKPDVAILVLGVKDQGSDISKIVKNNTQKMNTIISEIKKMGIEEKDIQTTQYTISPDYNWTEKEGRVFKGYIVNQEITIKVRDFEKIGRILDKATSNGANEVRNIQFTIDDLEKFRIEARAQAIKQAKEKAMLIAQQSGLKIVKIINITEGYQPIPQPIYRQGATKELYQSGGVPEIQPGQMEITSTVTLTYRVK